MYYVMIICIHKSILIFSFQIFSTAFTINSRLKTQYTQDSRLKTKPLRYGYVVKYEKIQK